MNKNLDFLKALHPPGTLFYLCGVTEAGPVSGGLYDDPNSALRDAMALDQQPNVKAVYISSQPVQNYLPGQALNCQVRGCRPPKNNDVIKLSNYFMDLDLVRESDTAATDQQLSSLATLNTQLQEDLSKENFPEMLVQFSGNGIQMFGKVDLVASQSNADLLKAVTTTFGNHYGTEEIKFDLAIYNPARLCRFPGTTNRKGNDPLLHRKSRVLHIPAQRITIDSGWLQAIAAKSAPTVIEKVILETSSVDGILQADQTPRFNLEAYLSFYSVQVIKTVNHGDAILHVLAQCLFNPNHGPGKAAIGQRADGTLFYICFHNSCSGFQWSDAKRNISEEASINQFFEGGKADYEELAGTVVSMSDVVSIDFPPTIPLIEDIISVGGATVISGAGGVGKSTLALIFAITLGSNGLTKYLDLDVANHVRTLMVQAENAAADTKDRLLAMSKHPGFQAGLEHVFSPTQNLSEIRVLDGDFNNDVFFKKILEDIRLTSVGLLIIDPLISFHRGDENDNSSMRRTLDRLTMLMSLTGVAIILIHHVGRAATFNGSSYAGRGASSVGDWAHNTFLFRISDPKAGIFELSCQKARNFKKPEPIYMTQNANLVFERHYPKGNTSNVFLQQTVVNALHSLGGKAKTQSELIEAIIKIVPDINETKAHGIIKEIAATDAIIEGKKGRSKTYELPATNSNTTSQPAPATTVVA